MPSFYKAIFGLILLQCNPSFAQGKLIMNRGSRMTMVNSTYLVTTDVSVADSSTLKVINSTIKIAGNINSNSAIDVDSGTVEMNGSSAQTIPANAFSTNKIQNLIISNDVSLAGKDSLTGELSFGLISSKTFQTGGFLTLKSSAAATANVADLTNRSISDNNQIYGDVTVERYIPARKGWWFLAVPTNTVQTVNKTWQEGSTMPNDNLVKGYGTQITGQGGIPAGFDVATSTPSMKKYNSLNNSWGGIASTSNNISAPEGYMTFIRGGRDATTFTSISTPTNMRTTGSLFTHGQPTITVVANKFASVGNPYPSVLDMRNIGKFGLKDFFYLWDPYLGGAYGLGGYQVFSNNGDDYIVTPGFGSYGPSGSISNYIQSGQAFLVQADSGGGNITFDESAKVGGLGPVGRSAKLPRPQLRANLYGVNTDSTSYIIDGILINYDNSYSNGVNGMDAIKPANTNENLSVKTDNTLLMIERRHTIIANDTIFLNLTNAKIQQYRFQFAVNELDMAGLTAFFEDTYLNTRAPLSLSVGTSADFNVTNIAGSYAPDRFRIVFSPSIVLPLSFTSLKAYQKNSAIAIEWKVENEVNIKQYEVEKSSNGLQFTNLSVTAATGNINHAVNYEAIDTHPIEGYNYYRIKSLDLNGRVQYTNIVKVLKGKGKQEITIYPNPIIDGVISIQLNNMPEGKYGVRLINNLGQKIIDKVIQHAGGSSTELITLDKMMPHGIYQLEIIKPGNEMITNKVIH